MKSDTLPTGMKLDPAAQKALDEHMAAIEETRIAMPEARQLRALWAAVEHLTLLLNALLLSLPESGEEVAKQFERQVNGARFRDRLEAGRQCGKE